ncbi:hypothetical protein WJX72_010594 [[Myrmecia] bisecta]|uniref:Ubiquitin-like protease family profile domain-containing protein n=1 Tax=[Myrmecia] bisecta TaxID=41462 RepID=A0AAW1PU36_9CHLO
MVRQPQVGRRGGTAFAAKQPLQSTRPLGSVRRHGPSSSVRYVLPDRPASLQQLQQGVLHAPAPDNAIRMLDEANVLEAKANVIRQTALQEMARNKRSGPVNYEAERQYQELIAQHERLQKGQAAVAAQAPTPAVIDMASPFGRDASAAQPPAQAAARATEAAQLAAARLVAEQSREQELERRQRKEQQRLRAKSADMFGGPSLQKLFARCDAALSTSGKSLAETQERDREMRLDLAESERQTLAALREAREQQRQRLQKAAPAWLRPAAAPLVPKPRAQPARRAAPPPPAQEECVDLVSSSEEEGEGETAHQEGDGLYGERGEYDQEAEEEEEAQSSYSQQAEEELSEAMAASVSLSASESEGPELARPYQPTAAHKRLYRQALDKGDPEEILMKHKNSNIDITRRLIKCMKPPEWLNDEVMNVYMGLLQDRDTRRRKAGRGPKCHFFNSFFINKLFLDQKPAAYAYANVRRWTNPKRLATWGQASASVLDCDVIIMPVHLGLHWTCAVVRLTDRELVYYDSMKGERADIMEALRQWVADEFKDKRNQDVDTSTWPIRYEKDIPQQHNGSDCGAFTLAFAEFEGRGASLAGAFAQEHMNAYRVKLTGEILSSCIST